VIAGNGLRFAAPGNWHVRRQGNEVSAAPKPTASELVSVSRFPLLKPYTPALFAAATKELDKSAADLAKQLGGSVVKSSTGRVAGQRVRRYVLVYPQRKGESGKSFSARITYVLRDRTEYELFCRWDGTGSAPDYCTRLEQTFRIRPA
jgi:sugar phosphate isomerase/epimerase